MFGPIDNRITADDRARVYEILGFAPHNSAHSIPQSLNLAGLMDGAPPLELYAKAREERRGRSAGGMLGGLTEFRVGVELAADRSTLRLTGVKRGRPNHAGREVDRTRTIVGTIHTHPWDVAQSIGDVRNLIRSNDILGGVVTYTGRMTLLVKHPEGPEWHRAPFAGELGLQGASLREAPNLLGQLGVFGVLSAAFDLPIRSMRDVYIGVVCGRLGLLTYEGDVSGSALRRGWSRARA
jgi:hypothetical protein